MCGILWTLMHFMIGLMVGHCSILSGSHTYRIVIVFARTLHLTWLAGDGTYHFSYL